MIANAYSAPVWGMGSGGRSRVQLGLAARWKRVTRVPQPISQVSGCQQLQVAAYRWTQRHNFRFHCFKFRNRASDKGMCTQEKLSPIASPVKPAAQTALVASIPPLNLEGAEPKLP